MQCNGCCTSGLADPADLLPSQKLYLTKCTFALQVALHCCRRTCRQQVSMTAAEDAARRTGGHERGGLRLSGIQ